MVNVLLIWTSPGSLTEVDHGRLAIQPAGSSVLPVRTATSLPTYAPKSSVRQDLLICDHEGAAWRFAPGGYASAADAGAGPAVMNDEGRGEGAGAMAATNAATALGYVLGAELRACGVDFSFTPVLDLDWGASGVIGDRAFHRDPRVAALLAKSLMHGLLRAGLANCGKHFPGHGFVKADSHTDIPVDVRSLQAILADDAAPYQWLNTSLSSVMPATSPPKGERGRFFCRWLNDAAPATGVRRGHLQRRLNAVGAR
jgi:beta-N-acetylhexosaminidase